MKNYFLFIIVVFSLFACNTLPQTDIKLEDFEDFYKKYYSDSVFQISRTNFPLPGYNSNIDMELPDDVAELMGIKKPDEYFWTEEKWNVIEDKYYDNDKFKKNIIQTDTLVIEEIFIPDSGFKIERKYRPINGNWYLVYYFYQNI